MILVLTNSVDATTDFLIPKLEASGKRFLRLNSDRIVSDSRVTVSDGRTVLTLNGITIEPGDVTSIWYRRPHPLEMPGQGNVERKAHAESEWAEALDGFLAQIPQSRWINHPANNALASHKIEQLARAKAYGLNVPDTIVTQSAEGLREFYKKHDGKLVCKPLSSGAIDDAAGHHVIYSSAVKETDLEQTELLARCPTLFQERIEKQFDVRITCVDGHLVAVGMLAKTEAGKQRLDIRRNNMADVTHGQVDIPSAVRESLCEYVASYDLRFAAIDMAVNLEGDWIFFEINPNGQWAWLDQSGASDIASLMVTALTYDRESDMKKPFNYVFNALFWLIMRASGIGCTFSEVVANAYEARAVPGYIKSISTPSEIHLEIAKAGFGRQEKRQQYVLDKAKSLMTLVGLLMSVLLATSIVGGLVTGTWLPLLILLISLVVLLIALIVLARLLSVGVYSMPSIDENLAKATKPDAQKKMYFDSTFVATNINWGANDFMVDVYRAANRLMLVGIALAAATVLVSLYTQHTKSSQVLSASASTSASPAAATPPAPKALFAATKTAPTDMKAKVPVPAAVPPSKVPAAATKK